MNAKPVGLLLQEPSEHVSECPGLRVPEIPGRPLLDGGRAATTPVWSDVAGTDPPALDPVTWRLDTPVGAVGLAALTAMPQRSVRAVLDCTGGWWTEQRWSGWRVDDVLTLAGRRFLGNDLNPEAVRLSATRLREFGQGTQPPDTREDTPTDLIELMRPQP